MSFADMFRQQIMNRSAGMQPQQQMPGMQPQMGMQMGQQPGLLQPSASQFLPAYPGANQVSDRSRLKDILLGGALSQPQVLNYLNSFPSPSQPMAQRALMPIQPSYGGLNDYIARMKAGYQPNSSYAPPPVPLSPMLNTNPGVLRGPM